MKLNRRNFLGLAASTSALGFTGCASILSCKNPCGKLRVGTIGCGGQGSYDVKVMSTHKRVEMAAFCDVDRKALERIGKLHPNAKLYQGWRDMLDKEDLDAVIVATPDHSHALIMSEVMRRGINLYAQKPLCRTFKENRLLESLAASSGVVTQLGTQITPWECDRHSEAIIRQGQLGEITKVWIFTNTGVYHKLLDRTKPIVNVKAPSTLDWNGWLEGAPYREYADEIYHPFRWRVWRDYGSGWLGDMASHLFSPVWLGMDLGAATRPVWAKAEVMDDGWTDAMKAQFLPQVSHITWGFPGVKATGGKPFEVEWFDGPKNWKTPIPAQFLPPKFLEELAAKTPLGSLPIQGRVVEGTKGIMISTHFNVAPVVIKRGKGASNDPKFVANSDGTFKTALPFLEPVPNHYHEFANCCIDGGTPTSNLGWTTKLTDTIILGNTAIANPGKKVFLKDLA